MKLFSKSVSVNDVYLLLSSIKFDSIFALPHFMELEAMQDENILSYVEISDAESEMNMIIPVIVSKSKLGLNTAFCPSPPQVVEDSSKDNERWKEILNTLNRYIRKNYNCIAISMNQRPHDPKFITNNLNECKISHNYDIMIDLSNEICTIYSNIDKRHRYTLRKATGCSDSEILSGKWLQKAVFTIKQGESQESLLEFRVLWIKTLERMYESFSTQEKLLYKDPLTLDRLTLVFNKLHPHGLVKLFTAYDNDKQPGASAIFFTSNNFTKIPMVYWSAGASSEEGRKKGLPLLLQWYVIRWFKEQGYQMYYMGGYDDKNPHSGPSLFKKGFGGQLVSGLTVTWLSQPFRSMRNIVSYIRTTLL